MSRPPRSANFTWTSASHVIADLSAEKNIDKIRPSLAAARVWQHEDLSGRIRFERSIRVGDGVKGKATGDLAGDRPARRERERPGNETGDLLRNDQPGPRTVLGDKDRSGVHQLSEVNRRQRARELPVVHETPAWCEQAQARLVGRRSYRIEHGLGPATAGMTPDRFSDILDRAIDHVCR